MEHGMMKSGMMGGMKNGGKMSHAECPMKKDAKLPSTPVSPLSSDKFAGAKASDGSKKK